MLELTVRLVVSLSIVVGLLLVLARVGGRKFRGQSGALVHVVHRQPLTRTSSVSVVTVGSRVLVLGTTEQQVSVLAELDPDEIDLPDTVVGDGADLADVSYLPAPPTSHLLPAPLVEQATPVVPVATAARRRPGSHRAAPAARTATAAEGPLAGSILSVSTWRQAFQAAGRGASRRAS